MTGLNKWDMPLVSVIIPTYNRIDTLPRSMKSVLDQTYGNLELIVVDDGSTDGTDEYVKGLPDERIRYVKGEGNRGPGAARNMGVRLAKGEYIAFQDSDDEWHPDKLEKQMLLLLNSELGNDMVYCEFTRYQGQTRGEVVPSKKIPIECKQGNMLAVLLLQPMISTQTIVIKKQSFIQAGGFQERLKTFEDYEFTLRFSQNHKIGFVEESLVKVYDSLNSVDKRFADRIRTQAYIVREMIGPLRKFGLLWEKLSAVQRAAEHLKCHDVFLEELQQLADLFTTEQEREYAAELREKTEKSDAKQNQYKGRVYEELAYAKQRLLETYVCVYKDMSVENEELDTIMRQVRRSIADCGEYFEISPKLRSVCAQEYRFPECCSKLERLSLLTDAVKMVEDLEKWIEQQRIECNICNNVYFKNESHKCPFCEAESAEAMTLAEIRNFVEKKEYVKAREAMDTMRKEGHPYTDETAILDAAIYEALGDRRQMFLAIKEGLSYSYANYELYYTLGYYYLQDNVNQAYLCFQNALLFCNKEEDAAIIAADMEELCKTGQVTVQDTAIVIVSYNECYMMQKNVESIRDTLLPGTYRIIVVDNASEDGVADWLREQQDVLLLENRQNTGFAPACNQAVKALRERGGTQNDLFLLNNDTRLAPNALFWLRMGLYQDAQVGAVGSMSNYAGNNQQLEVVFTLPKEYLEYGARRNIPDECPYEERVRLSGFAMLIRGHVWDETGGMDESFAPGYFEDDDLSMRIMEKGYRLLVCKNSFVYHAGSQSFSKQQNVDEILVSHYQLFMEKYGFDILKYTEPRMEELLHIPFSREDTFNVLQIGSGLGADLKYIRTMFPKANVVGIEKDEALYRISQGTELVFRDPASALEVLQRPVFHVLLINAEEQAKMSRVDLHVIRQLCVEGFVTLPGDRKEESVRLDQVKLVIWDLDQTFWRGILSEGGISVEQDRVALIKDLTDCGIISSISSKNNEEEVLQALEGLGIAELFVFNTINWENKGEQIRVKLEDMHLRPENVLFIDDDPRNLEEARYYNPGLMTADPGMISELIRYVKGLKRRDPQHKRLDSYKVMEKRRKEEKSSSTKESFLYESGIIVEIHQDCINQLDRIAELTARTNQLNFTKVRDDREKLYNLLQDKRFRNGYVRVHDKFGDYGIVGFYSYNCETQKLRHFLFSCRIIGMGIAECVYGWLRAPGMEIVEPVAVRLEENMKTPWIHLEMAQSEDDRENWQNERADRIRVLLKGPCDMSAIESYLSGGDITTEFNYVNDQGFITTGQNHSMHIWQSAMLSREQIAELTADVPFIVKGDFQTDIFRREYHVICYSLLPDCHAGLYRSKKTGNYISFGSRNFDLTDPKNTRGYVNGSIVNHAFPFTEEIIARFASDWEFVGATSGKDLIRNLDYIYTHVPGTPMFILLLGSEIEYRGASEEFAGHAGYHREVNALIKEYARDKERMRIIDMTDYIDSQDDYGDCINHFSRDVYYRLATTLCAYINEQVEYLKKHKK